MSSSLRIEAFVAAAAVAMALAGAVSAGAIAQRSSDGQADQCALPVAQRTGAWTCAGPAGDDAGRR